MTELVSINRKYNLLVESECERDKNRGYSLLLYGKKITLSNFIYAFYFSYNTQILLLQVFQVFPSLFINLSSKISQSRLNVAWA
jgi:hypothetical protein